jgi:hypothetical protein
MLDSLMRRHDHYGKCESKDFFRLAADHHELLVDFYQSRGGITEVELPQVIEKTVYQPMMGKNL